MLVELRHHPRLTTGLVFAALFALILLVLFGIGISLVQQELDRRVNVETAAFDSFTRDLGMTIKELKAPPDTEPCSEAHLTWMRRVAFLPDGIHEIIYAPGNRMLCSVSSNRFDTPVELGRPDFDALLNGVAKVWLDRDLGPLGFPGLTGTFLAYLDYILVVPKTTLTTSVPDWFSYEIVQLAENGTLFNRQGVPGLYGAAAGITSPDTRTRDHQIGLSSHGCETSQKTCIAISVTWQNIVSKGVPIILGDIVLAALLAGVLTAFMDRLLKRFWSFPSRFRRSLNAQNIVCHYQPLVELDRERIWGVEVLARYRDDDGTLVYPDAFLSVVEKHRLHRRFTQLVVDKAYADLSALPGRDRPLKVHFNIFPCEFDVDWMFELFAVFLADKSRFEVIIELVESDALPIDSTRRAISRLRGAGIRTFIDDFGEGYSSIGYLAGLGTYGVKLDRSFGQAREGSLMEAMLTSAIEMVSKTGQVLVVEGVETAGRLAALKNSRQVAIVQGYFISRPMGIDDLRHILAEGDLWSAAEAA